MSLPEVPESKLLGYRFKKYSLKNLSRLTVYPQNSFSRQLQNLHYLLYSI